MQVIKIIKDTSKSRVFFYGKNDTLLFSADATASFSADHTKKTVAINFEAEGSLPASFGWASGLIYLGVDANPPVLQTGTFDAFLTALKDDYFSQSASGGGGGGGGGGDATAAKQDEQTAFLENLSTAAGKPTDSPTTNPFDSSTQTALQKGIFANGLRVKSFDQVVDKSTNTEYLRAVDFDPNTPPAEIKYLDPQTGLQVTAPTNTTTLLGVSKEILGRLNPATQTFASSFPIAGTNATVIKNGAGEILSGNASNNTATAKFIHFYNFAATAPNATTNIGAKILTIALPAQVGANVQIPKIPFSVGLSFLVSTNVNPNLGTAIPQNSCNLTFVYS